jgi:hypothetical protein
LLERDCVYIGDCDIACRQEIQPPASLPFLEGMIGDAQPLTLTKL